ncbi:methionyl-tRNA synthetase [Lasiosphaeria hispida]|uniref:methionine--tRNA ligase n=1 Tax=Lasiosphaeria hispida TaxID=260671 RepID=A0AAJ0H7K4_9PEZI|nr:methionyl-tRNA synthetase [Lasiosphaeria hispida]
MAGKIQNGSVVLPEAGKQNILVTSALPYVNNVPHLGNIIGSVLSADVFARYSRARGNNTLFIGGTDEYGTSAETRAYTEGCTERELCDKYHAIHANIYRWFNISFDIFGRTTTQLQTEIAQHIFLKLDENGFLKERTAAQLYCQEHGSFLADRLVEGKCPTCGYADARGDQCDHCGNLLEPLQLSHPRCKLDGSTPTIRDAKHMFLDLDTLQPNVEDLFRQSADRGAWSSNAEDITDGWLRRGLKPLDITRDMKWGTAIPLPGYDDKVMYAWFDACIGYVSITANYTDQWERWWRNPDNVELYQFMGKDNAAFHTVVFPASQIGTEEIWTKVHHLSATEYLTYEGGKFSKSRSTGVFGDSVQEIQGVAADAWRFNLLHDRPETSNSEFTWDQFIDRHNSCLCDGIGAFVYSTMQYLNHACDGIVGDWTKAPDWLRSRLEAWQHTVNTKLAGYIQQLDAVQLRAGLRTIIQMCRSAQYTIKPWHAMPLESGQWTAVLGFAANLLHLLAALIAPYMPATAESINTQLGAEALAIPDSWGANSLKPGHRIGKEQMLFQKIDREKAREWRDMFGGSKAERRAAKKVRKEHSEGGLGEERAAKRARTSGSAEDTGSKQSSDWETVPVVDGSDTASVSLGAESE